MTLAIQLLGCAGAVVLIAVLVRGDTSRRTIAVTAAGLSAVIVSLPAIQGAWRTAQSQRAAAEQQRRIPAAAATVAGAGAAGVKADFVEWAVQQTTAADTWYLVGKDEAVTQWLSYRMLPRLTVERPEKGTWLVFYNRTPRSAGYTRAQLDDVRRFAPGFSMARLAGAGGTK